MSGGEPSSTKVTNHVPQINFGGVETLDVAKMRSFEERVNTSHVILSLSKDLGFADLVTAGPGSLDYARDDSKKALLNCEAFVYTRIWTQ